MPADAACPDREQYRQALAGAISDPEQLALLADHLERCPRCPDTLHGLGAVDTFVKVLGLGPLAAPPGEDDVVAHLIDHILRFEAAAPPPLTPGHGSLTDKDLRQLFGPAQAAGE